jgi:hypothetical protein
MLAAAILLCTSGAAAQGNGRGHQRIRGERLTQRADPARRQALEQQFQERTEQVVRKKLNLNDQQMARLRAMNSTIVTQRNALVDQERSVRAGLRDEMAKGNGADQKRVAQLMAQARDLQNRRFALQQTEQQQLSGFMTPVQVAQYIGLQAQMRQRVREMLQGKSGGDGTGVSEP